MTGKSALVGLMLMVIGCGCASSDKSSEYMNSEGKDNITAADNSTRHSSYIGFWPFLLGRFLNIGNSKAVTSPTAEQNKQNNAANATQNQGRKSDLKARGSDSFFGSSGS